MRLTKNQLKEKLDNHYKFFDKSQISPDPLEFPHRFKNENDIEISAFIASIFAYGNIKQIINSLEKLHTIMGESPYEFVFTFQKNHEKYFKDFKHRFYTTEDVIHLFKILSQIIKKEDSIKNHFYTFYNASGNIKDSIHLFGRDLIKRSYQTDKLSHGLKFMFPDPYKGSAAKRMNLFLRWMIRKDELDFGFWDKIPKSDLIIPVDTHIAKICKELKLTTLKNVSWKMAEEITNNLKKYDAIDPVKYDFAICHIGMRKLNF